MGADARATTMRDAARRWYDAAMAPFARDAVVALDAEAAAQARAHAGWGLSLIHISEPTRPY